MKNKNKSFEILVKFLDNDLVHKKHFSSLEIAETMIKKGLQDDNMSDIALVTKTSGDKTNVKIFKGTMKSFLRPEFRI